MTLRNTCELHVGRLLELRIDAGYRDRSEVVEIFSKIMAVIAQVSNTQRLIVVTDWRNCKVMAEDAAEQLTAGIRGTNPRIERSGALLPTRSPVATLQFRRVLLETQNPERRGFTDPENLIAWLSEVLTPEEVARLRIFLGQ